MMNLPKPEVILTHESDLDGLVSGLLLQRLARHLFQEDIPLEAYHYHAWRQRELSEASAWVSDLGFEKRLDKPSWLVVDHHPTDLEPKKGRLIHDTTKSAGLLCYELCQKAGLGNEALDRLVRLNDVSDLFLEDDPDFVLAGDYASLVKVYGFWNIHSLLEGNLEALVDHDLLKVMETKRNVEDPLGLKWSLKHIDVLNDTTAFVHTVIGNTNLIVYKILEQEDIQYQVLVTLFRRANGMMIASFRSRNGEAIKVASKFQGGGHPNACGATLPRSIRSIHEAVQYMRQVLNPPQESDSSINSLESMFDAIEASVKKKGQGG